MNNKENKINPTKQQWEKIFYVASKIEKRHENINQAYIDLVQTK
jgi:hypothetical protein